MDKETDHISLTRESKIWRELEAIKDPEVPVLSIVDLGVVRKVEFVNDSPVITITPTYSGCPAMDTITMAIRITLASLGFNRGKVETVLSPAWTTEWMSEEGRKRLKEYGIAPPNPKQQVCNDKLFAPDEAVQCPHCNSYHTTRISEFGSTACKSLYRCEDCLEPFDYFKCH